jgi:hypothetical protein
MQQFHRLALVVGAASLVASLASPGAQVRGAQSTFDIQVGSLASPAAAASGQPQLTVSSRGVLLSWIERSGPAATLKFAERTLSGWSATRSAASGENWFVNWADVPSVLRLSDGTLWAHWLQKTGPGTYAYDVRLSHSSDDGKTWSASVTPHHDTAKAEHGFASLVEISRGSLGLVWLDGRAMGPDSHAASATDHRAMTLRSATFDSKGTQTSEAPIDLRVCECCPTTAAMTADGLLTAYRDRSDKEVRNINVTRLQNGKWSEPAAVHDDAWQINGCPVNGPMIAASGRDVAIAWFTGKDPQGRALVAFSSDAGRTFGEPIRVDDAGTLGRVDVDLLPGGAAVVSWIEFAGGRAEFRARRIDRTGAKSPAVTIASVSSGRDSGYPRLARFGAELIFAWIEKDDAAPAGSAAALRVRVAAARLPKGGLGTAIH